MEEWDEFRSFRDCVNAVAQERNFLRESMRQLQKWGEDCRPDIQGTKAISASLIAEYARKALAEFSR